MKFVLTADWHITSQAPVNRIDDYKVAQFRKIEFILSYARNIDASILLAGDMFDSPFITDVPHTTIQAYWELIKDWEVPIYTVFGQHDLRYRSDFKNTPLYTLQKMSRYLDLLTYREEGAEMITFTEPKNMIILYSSGFGEIEPKPAEGPAFKILLTHRMVIDDKKIYPGQDDFITSSSLLRRGFDLVVSGDNHQHFVSWLRGKLLVNAGTIMRNRSDLVDFLPRIVVFDTETREVDVVPIPIDDADLVFDLDKIDHDHKMDESMNIFVEGLVQQKEIGLKFEENLHAIMKANKAKRSIVNLVQESLG